MSEMSPAAEAVDLPRAFILDTNVILYDPGAIYVFHEHDVIIPMTVIEEIDRFKKDLNETGRNARQFSRYLDGMRDNGSLHDGVTLPGGGRLYVDFLADGPQARITWGADTGDNRILATVLRLHKRGGRQVALVTRDTNMRLKCDALGVSAEDYEHAHIQVDEQYTGATERVVPASVIDDLYQSGAMPIGDLERLRPHEFVVLQAEGSPNQTAMVRVDTKRNRLKLVMRHKEGVWGIFARNKEQLFALNLLLDDDVCLVTLNGVAGTGKTLLTLACGLQKAL
ncbi:MAG: PhoH family protein, partial [Deltaproteobacteria bacterium]|nr:PhoH family protein [Deltaproteobacteria bacterium]